MKDCEREIERQIESKRLKDKACRDVDTIKLVIRWIVIFDHFPPYLQSQKNALWRDKWIHGWIFRQTN